MKSRSYKNIIVISVAISVLDSTRLYARLVDNTLVTKNYKEPEFAQNIYDWIQSELNHKTMPVLILDAGWEVINE